MAKKDGLGNAIVIGLIGLAMAAVGCGDDGNSKLDGFLGTWEYTQSGGTYTCPGEMPLPQGFSGRKTWGEGVTSDLVDLTFSCDYKFDVTNKIASIQSSQHCLLLDPNTGGTVTDTPSTWTFTLLSATTAEEKASTLDDFGCALEITATLAKISKD